MKFKITKKTGEKGRSLSSEADGAPRNTATEDDVAAKVIDKLLKIEDKRREILQKQAPHNLKKTSARTESAIK